MGGAMFSCAYLNDISGLMEGNIFARSWFKPFDQLPAGRRYEYKMGVDLASSEKQRADWTAAVTIAQDDLGNTYVLDAVRTKTESGHRQFVIDAFLRDPAHPISRIVIENNQFQSTLVAELLKTTTLPVIGKRSDVDKVTRARAVAARYESGKVFHHRHLAAGDFELELLQFPKGHDDWIDALGNAMETGSSNVFWGTLGYR
jgi:predicted phage terminase large subunit-like protein